MERKSRYPFLDILGRFAVAAAVVALTVLPPRISMSATFHATNQAEFLTAMNSSRTNGQDDTIYLSAGSFLGGLLTMNENHSITIQGAGAGQTKISPLNVGHFGFGYQTISTGDSAAHFTLKGVTLQGAASAENGLLVMVTQANITIEDCEFSSNNSSALGAGLHIRANGTSAVVVRNNVFKNNSQTGGTAQGAGANVSSYGPISIGNNTFSDNISQSGGGALAAHAGGSHPLNLSGNSFIANSAANEGGGASITASDSAAVIMVNNLFYQNTANQSGGAQVQSLGTGDITVVNNTFYKNSSNLIGGLMAWPKNGTTSIYNNILYDNTGTELGILNEESTLIKLYNNDVGTWLVADQTNLQQGSNINSDPLLDSLRRLTSGSPCINVGLTAAPSLPDVDIDGNPRVVNSTVDMGAAEYQGASSTPPTVTTAPLSILAQQSATGGGTVTSGGSEAVSARGVCWGTAPYPGTTNSCTNNGSGIGSFTSPFSGLAIHTLYHVRAYATNAAGTAYGEDISFTTNLCPIDVAKGGTSYMTLQEAVNSGSGADITVVARSFRENILFSSNGALKILGGYNCEFNAASGMTAVNGTMTIAGSGAVTMGNMTVY